MYAEFWNLMYREKAFPSYSSKSENPLTANRVIKLVLINKEKNKSKAAREDFANMCLTGSIDWIQGLKTPLSLERTGTLNKNGVVIFTLNILKEGAPGVWKNNISVEAVSSLGSREAPS